MGTLLLGTSGWDYPEWVGRVYPPHGASDRLRYYTGLFPIVEVNSTFYRLPPPSVAESWARRTPPLRNRRFANGTQRIAGFALYVSQESQGGAMSRDVVRSTQRLSDAAKSMMRSAAKMHHAAEAR